MKRASLIPCVLALLSPICLLLSASSALAVVTFNDGGVHNINGASDQIDILDGPGNAPTTVNVQPGAVVGATLTSFSVNARDHTIFTMSGGSLFDELFLFNNASAQLTGGSIGDDLTPDNNSTVLVTSVTVNDDVEAHGLSIVTINNGSFDEDVETLDSAKITINGGMFQTGTDGANVTAGGTSVINIHGGTFGVGHTDTNGAFNANENAVISIHGGNISGQPQGLNATGNGVINVYGFSGGQPAKLTTSGNGKINFLEGPLQNLVATGTGIQLSGTDGSLASIVAEDSSVLTIFGTNFKALNGAVNLNYGPISLPSGNLSGVLADGTPITNVAFVRNLAAAGGSRGVIILAAPITVPEPCTATMVLLGLAGCMAGRGRRQRSQVHSDTSYRATQSRPSCDRQSSH